MGSPVSGWLSSIRATGVLNLAFGAVGAFGALLAWQLINHSGWAEGPAYLACILFGGRGHAPLRA